MRISMKKLLAAAMTAFMTVGYLCPVQGAAADRAQSAGEGKLVQLSAAKKNKKKYKKAYKKILEETILYYKDKTGITVTTESYTPRSFCLLDVDKNGVPELIVKDVAASDGMAYNNRHVYTMKKGKAVYCGTYFNRVGADVEYSPKHKSFYMWWWTNFVGGVGGRLFRLKNGKLKVYQSVWEGAKSSSPNSKKVYKYIAGDKEMKEVSKKKYKTMVKRYFKEKRKSYSFTDNTEANRIRLLGQ
ncbi:MAG: hypothetical protein Q4D60_09210 [Eubacteriales bacterium]|nr:hypothetical protein [Eubacteriales bacterium]